MTHFHAVMIDETGCEFGASVEAASRSAAYERLRLDYPESRVAQLESPEDTARREQAMYDDIRRGIYRNEDGSIDHVEPGYDDGYDEDEDEDEDEVDDWDDYTDEERAERHQLMAEAEEDE